MAPPSRHDFPAALFDFARTLQGSYAERFDAILDRAFTAHEGLLLSGHGLRALAGGGTNPVAQDALERFRRRLYKAIGTKVAYASDLPDALGARFGAVIGEMWADARRVATTEFDDVRAQLTSAAQHAQDAAEVANRQRDDSTRLAEQLRTELNLARFDVEQLQGRTLSLSSEVENCSARLNRSQVELADAQRLCNERGTLLEALETLQRQSQSEHMVQLKQLEQDARARLDALTSDHRTEREAVRHEHLLQTDNMRQEARRREEAIHQQLVEARSRSESCLQALGEQKVENAALLAQLTATKTRLDVAEASIAKLERRNEALAEVNGALRGELQRRPQEPGSASAPPQDASPPVSP